MKYNLGEKYSSELNILCFCTGARMHSVQRTWSHPLISAGLVISQPKLSHKDHVASDFYFHREELVHAQISKNPSIKAISHTSTLSI